MLLKVEKKKQEDNQSGFVETDTGTLYFSAKYLT